MIDLTLIQKAIALTQNGYVLEAEQIYLNLLAQEPDNDMLLSVLGLFYVNVHDFEKACDYLQKACKIKETLGTVSALGFCEYEQENFEQAAKILEHSLEFGESEDIYNKLVLSLFQIKNYKKAVEYTQKMYEKYPDSENSTANMVKALTQSGKLIEAEKICTNYLKKHNNAIALWFHLGYLKELIYCDDKQACECYKIASELGNKEAYYNIAVSYQKMGDYDKAEEYYHKMLEIYPKDIDTITSLGMCCLTRKKFKEGYDLFFLRDKSSLDKLTQNPWQPGQEFEKNVVVMCDQGFGDHIQFIRYLPFLKAKVQNLYVAAQSALRNLFQVNYPDIKFITYEEIDPNMQSVRVTDLAYALNIDFDNIPFAQGYLKSESADIESDKPKIGICWEAGSAGIRTMINRTINVKLLEPILNLDSIQLYSFQVRDTLNGNERYPQMVNLAKDFKNFEDTARAMKSMDLIISVDTSVAHLAGALGVKTFLILPYTTDWRWFDDIKTTPWYESIEIFKQNDPISWEQPIKDIVSRLEHFAK